MTVVALVQRVTAHFIYNACIIHREDSLGLLAAAILVQRQEKNVIPIGCRW